MSRCYGRNGVRGWTIEAQKRVLDETGHYDPAAWFEDNLAATKAKKPGRIRPEWLAGRQSFLRETSRRGEVIVVATPLALGVNERDLAHALRDVAEKRHATVLFADSGVAIAPGDPFAVAVDAWHEAMKKATTKTSRIAGSVAAAAAKRKVTAEKIRIAEPLWPLPTEEISTADIAAKADLSEKTLYNELGPRSEAQARLRRRLRRKSA